MHEASRDQDQGSSLPSPPQTPSSLQSQASHPADLALRPSSSHSPGGPRDPVRRGLALDREGKGVCSCSAGRRSSPMATAPPGRGNNRACPTLLCPHPCPALPSQGSERTAGSGPKLFGATALAPSLPHSSVGCGAGSLVPAPPRHHSGCFPAVAQANTHARPGQAVPGRRVQPPQTSAAGPAGTGTLGPGHVAVTGAPGGAGMGSHRIRQG